jgi:tRNA (cytidine/uridine-2'-O-)-methyltransferase
MNPKLALVNVVLVHPEIPPNTGNVIRLCANAGATLHLIEPLGFPIDHAKMRRAGLDYHELTSFALHASWSAFLETEKPNMQRLFAFTTKGSHNSFAERFERGDWLVFGSETQGLPAQLREQIDPTKRLRLPMREGNRSLNLSNSVAVAVYEAWRQLEFTMD